MTTLRAEAAAEPRRPVEALAPALYLCSFASGVAALVYQVVWTRLFSLSFGGTTLAASAVITGFMGGMGLGAWLYHRAGRRAVSSLRLYAGIEIGIAGAALLLTLALPQLPAVFAEVSRHVPPGCGRVALRFVLAFGLLLVPSALMGATFPALSVALIETRRGLGRHLGMLYGLNTVGAAAGALLAGLLLIERIGLRNTVLVGNALNLAVGVFAFALAARHTRRATLETGSGDATPATRLETPLPYRLTGAVLLLSGFATLCYEILWFRSLTYLFGNSTYAFSVMLFIFLTGLGLGALAFRWVARRRHPERDLAFCQLGIALFAVAAVGGIALIVGNASLEKHVSIFLQGVYAKPWWQRLLIDSGLALVLMLPATLLMGLSFPLASSLFLADLRRLGERLGGAVLLANLGSILGALCAALLVLPRLGTVSGTRAVAALNLLLGLAVLSRLPRSGGVASMGRNARLTWATGAAVGLAGLSLALPDRIAFVGSGAAEGSNLVFEAEGDLATVQVWQDREHPAEMGMAIDGTTIGATPRWSAVIFTKQILLAHLPVVLDTRIRDVLSIGLGSASTLNALASHPTLRSLDTVEINAPVVRAAGLFPEAAVLDDERVTLSVDDALHYLLVGTRRYDLIVSDGKQAMDFSGNAKLLSREFYQLCLDRLHEDGLFVQWIPISIGADEYATILRTLLESFPELEVFHDLPVHTVFVGSRKPLTERPRLTQKVLAGRRAAADLDILRIPDVESLLGRWMASAAQLRSAVGPGPINTWDHAILEFSAYKQNPSIWRRGTTANLRLLLAAAASADSPTGALLAPAGAASVRAQQLLRRAYLASSMRDRASASAYAARAVVADPDDPAARYWLANFRNLEQTAGQEQRRP